MSGPASHTARPALSGADDAATTAAGIADAVARRETTARTVVADALDRIRTLDASVNAFTDVVAERAMATATALDERIAAGEPVGPLCGVPFAVKNLFDVAGLPTRAGSLINRERTPAARDGTLIARLEAAGAVLVGALNMGEYAYDFTGENAHDGASRNPHALEHMSGGSSGGSAAAVAAGMVPITLGSDTNGSIRVPSAFCGTFGLKPTYGRLSRAGSFPFVGSLDHLGPFARSAVDLALAYDAMQGPDPADPHLAARPAEPALQTIEQGPGALRIAVADGYFEQFATDDARAALAKVADALGARRRVSMPYAAQARAAAYVITAAEGSSLHVERLARRAADYDADTRYRLLAGAAIPAAWVDRAQKLRRVYRAKVREIFDDVDIILAPSTPCRALKLGQKTLVMNGETLPARPNIGLFTQPISFIGLPVVAVPVWLDDGLPLGVQVIAAPWREADALRVAYALERSGVAAAPVATLRR